MNETSCFSLLSGCAKTVSEPHVLILPGLLSSEEQIPQIVVNVRSWRETMETLEEMTLLDTQEVRDSSSLRPTAARSRAGIATVAPQQNRGGWISEVHCRKGSHAHESLLRIRHG